MACLSFEERIRLEKEDLIIAYYGIHADFGEFFAFVLCDKAGIRQMRADYDINRAERLEQYGKVIYLDWIREPDEKAESHLEGFIAHYSLIKELL